MKYSNILTNVVLPSIFLTLCDMKIYGEKICQLLDSVKCMQINVGGSISYAGTM